MRRFTMICWLCCIVAGSLSTPLPAQFDPSALSCTIQRGVACTTYSCQVGVNWTDPTYQVCSIYSLDPDPPSGMEIDATFSSSTVSMTASADATVPPGTTYTGTITVILGDLAGCTVAPAVAYILVTVTVSEWPSDVFITPAAWNPTINPGGATSTRQFSVQPNCGLSGGAWSITPQNPASIPSGLRVRRNNQTSTQVDVSARALQGVPFGVYSYFLSWNGVRGGALTSDTIPINVRVDPWPCTAQITPPSWNTTLEAGGPGASQAFSIAPAAWLAGPGPWWQFIPGVGWPPALTLNPQNPTIDSVVLDIQAGALMPLGTYSGTLRWTGTCNLNPGTTRDTTVAVTVVAPPCNAGLSPSTWSTTAISGGFAVRQAFAIAPLGVVSGPELWGFLPDPGWPADLDWTLPSGSLEAAELVIQAQGSTVGGTFTGTLQWTGVCEGYSRTFSAAVEVKVPVTSPDSWVSEFNGPSNARRAEGQLLAAGWTPKWSSPRVANSPNRPVVKDGLVVFRNDPNALRYFAALDLATGAVVWSEQAAEAGEDIYKGICISGNHVFIPMASTASQTNKDERVEVRELATGALIRRWDSNIEGRISAMQALPAASEGRPRAAFTNSELPGALNFRMNIIDGLSTQRSASLSGVGRINHVAPTFDPIGQEVIAHELIKPNPPNSWRSNRLLAYDIETLVRTSTFLSGQSLDPRDSSQVRSPLVIDPERSEAYLYQTDGSLTRYDLAAGLQSVWSVSASTTVPLTLTHHLSPVLLDSVVVLADEDTGIVRGYSRVDGNMVWELSAPTTLPAAPVKDAAVVMDGDLVLLPLIGGAIHAVDATGTLTGPYHQFGATVEFVIPVAGRYLVAEGNDLVCYEPMTLSLGTPPLAATPIEVQLSSPGDANLAYVAALSFDTVPGVVLGDGRLVPMNLDILFWFSVTPGNPYVVGGFGTLNGAGEATVTVNAPPGVEGLTVYSAYLTLDPLAPVGVSNVSPALPITFE